MHLSIISPIGFITSLDLDTLPIWRMEMRAQNWLATEYKALALGIAYVVNGQAAYATICSINCKVMGEDVDPIAKVGFPEHGRSENKARVREAMKSLINSGMVAKEVEEIAASSATLVDAYHDIQRACWGMNPGLASLGPLAKGDLGGWRWALMRERFSPWISESLGAAHGFGAAPGSTAPSSMAPPPGAPAGDDELGARDPLGIGPAPGTEKKGAKKKPATDSAAETPPSGPPPLS